MKLLDPIARRKDEQEYYCPRCGGVDLIDFGGSFDCVECQLEFDKRDVDDFEHDEVLSVQEKKALRVKLWSSWF